MRLYKGKARCEGKRVGSVCIIHSGEELKDLIGKKLTYTLLINETPKEIKAAKHEVEFMSISHHGRRLYNVKSCESKNEYIVDVSFGCGCASYSISGRQMCSCIMAVLERILIESSLTRDSTEQGYEGDQ